jgi:hypothetical protein
MNSDHTHLTEEERHSAAEGTLDTEQRATVEEHLAACAACAADVTRITTLMKRTRETPPPSAPLDELWPSIRSRIEERKVVPLTTDAVATPRERRHATLWVATVGVAAALLIAAFALRSRNELGGRAPLASATDSALTLVALADSVGLYEREAQILLDKLELQRAMLRPDAAQALEHDLHAVDVAIAELKDAVARDPANPALRQLLATSYRQKVDLLKRVGNAS